MKTCMGRAPGCLCGQENGEGRAGSSSRSLASFTDGTLSSIPTPGKRAKTSHWRPDMIRSSIVATALLLASAAATPLPPLLLAGLLWRNTGPFRGGRISAAARAIGDVGTFYVGPPGDRK